MFWESHTIDVFQSNCFSRPFSLRPEHIDTKFPAQTYLDGPTGAKSFKILKYELGRLSGECVTVYQAAIADPSVLEHAMDVRPKAYSSVEALYDRLCAFEQQIPFPLRCRTALLALPSVYPDPDVAVQESPSVNRRNLHRTLQQFTLYLNISEQIVFLQRPYFVRALQEEPRDPTRSQYAKSYLAAVERCNVGMSTLGHADVYRSSSRSPRAYTSCTLPSSHGTGSSGITCSLQRSLSAAWC